MPQLKTKELENSQLLRTNSSDNLHANYLHSFQNGINFFQQQCRHHAALINDNAMNIAKNKSLITNT